MNVERRERLSLESLAVLLRGMAEQLVSEGGLRLEGERLAFPLSLDVLFGIEADAETRRLRLELQWAADDPLAPEPPEWVSSAPAETPGGSVYGERATMDYAGWTIELVEAPPAEGGLALDPLFDDSGPAGAPLDD